MKKERVEWIDQARGFAIFLVVYGHNFPFCEAYIYSFHVPLFFLISGMFHPEHLDIIGIKKRAKVILIPYFLWAGLLFLFWLCIGRKFGNSAVLDLSPYQNLLGVFYAQGGQSYMDWGIPIWFLPCLFLVYLIYGLILRLSNKMIFFSVLCLLVLSGFLWSHNTETKLPWSIDVAMVALSFYGLGNCGKEYLISLTRKRSLLIGVFLLGVNIIGYYLNTEKIDMYRSIYGNPLLFILSGSAGAIGFMMLIKSINLTNFLGYLGRNSVVILAAHTRVLTVIKFGLLLFFGMAIFEFSEVEKFVLAIIQIILLIPVIWIVNNYIPILNAKRSKAH